jgi:hypothetical protein
LEFKLGKENILNGNTATVGDKGMTKVSICVKGGVLAGRTMKISKFSRLQ